MSNNRDRQPRKTNERRPEGKRRPEFFRAPADENPIAGLFRYLAASDRSGGRALAR